MLIPGLTEMDIQPHWCEWSPRLRRLGAAALLVWSQSCRKKKKIHMKFFSDKVKTSSWTNQIPKLFLWHPDTDVCMCVCVAVPSVFSWLTESECGPTCDWGWSFNLIELQMSLSPQTCNGDHLPRRNHAWRVKKEQWTSSVWSKVL